MIFIDRKAKLNVPKSIAGFSDGFAGNHQAKALHF